MREGVRYAGASRPTNQRCVKKATGKRDYVYGSGQQMHF